MGEGRVRWPSGASAQDDANAPTFTPEERRVYPTGIAAQVLGIVDIESHGLAGLEQRYDDVLRVLVHPTQPMFITASADKTIRTWKDDGSPMRSISGLSDVPFALAISPDGARIAAAGYDGVVRVMKLPNGEAITAFAAKP